MLWLFSGICCRWAPAQKRRTATETSQLTSSTPTAESCSSCLRSAASEDHPSLSLLLSLPLFFSPSLCHFLSVMHLREQRGENDSIRTHTHTHTHTHTPTHTSPGLISL